MKSRVQIPSLVVSIKFLFLLKRERLINGKTWKDRIQNEKVLLKLGVAPIDENTRDNSLEMMWPCSKESN